MDRVQTKAGLAPDLDVRRVVAHVADVVPVVLVDRDGVVARPLVAQVERVPELVAGVTDVFCYIEDMPPAAFDDGIPWTWETFDQYRDVIDGMGVALHTAVLIGHTPLRMYVMGDDAWTRAATEAETAQLAAVLDLSLIHI